MVKRILRDERGQSAIVMAMIVIAILAIFALVVDIGNAYAERRRAQTAADAAALAGAQRLSERVSTNRSVRQAVVDFAQRNGIPPDATYMMDVDGDGQVDEKDAIEMYYTDVDGNILEAIANTTAQPRDDAVGVHVKVYKEFNTYFARVLRRDTLPAAADSTAYVCYGLKGSGGLFPIAVSKDLFAQDPDGLPEFGKTYTIWENKRESPGNFGWVNWGDRGMEDPHDYGNGHQGPSNTALANNMHYTQRSSNWSAGDWMDSSTGSMVSNHVRNELDMRMNGTLDRVVTVPIYDAIEGTGANTRYRISGFAHFRIMSYNHQGNDKYVIGRFEQWAAAGGNTGGTRYGGRSACFPVAAKDAVIGDIKVRVPTLKDYTEETTEFPMDIVLVMDKSGSMSQSFASGGRKIDAAKNALTGFLDRTAPTDLCAKEDGSPCQVCGDAKDEDDNPCTPENCPDACKWLVDTEGVGDQVGFVYYPTTYTGSSFRATCSNRWRNTYYVGSTRNELTGDKDDLKSEIDGMGTGGWTPIAPAMNEAIDVIENDWRGDSLKFVILASDGMANVPLNGQPSEVDDGRYGPYWPYPACNQAAADDAIAEAIRASNRRDLPEPEDRGVEAVVFTIAIGQEGNFNTTLLEYMASQNPNWKPGDKERFFYNAANPEELDQAYADIQREIETIKEGCSIAYYNDLAAGATVTLKQGGVVKKTETANQAGGFTFGDVEPGTYTVEVEYDRDGIVYDTYVDQLGGAPLDSDQWAERYTITVPDDGVEQTYGPVSFYLHTDQAPACTQ